MTDSIAIEALCGFSEYAPYWKMGERERKTEVQYVCADINTA
jgi:predicted SAM-dependent methyltransferase